MADAGAKVDRAGDRPRGHAQQPERDVADVGDVAGAVGIAQDADRLATSDGDQPAGDRHVRPLPLASDRERPGDRDQPACGGALPAAPLQLDLGARVAAEGPQGSLSRLGCSRPPCSAPPYTDEEEATTTGTEGGTARSTRSAAKTLSR
jgi:hypothetical protein